jgi:cytochrome c-type biogenesis protein
MPDITPLFIFSTFVAGIATFLAPCTLPLLPAYIGFLSGITQEGARSDTTSTKRKKVLKNALAFVLGFSLVFILFGLLAGLAGTLFTSTREVLTVVGGVFMLFFGFFMLGLFNWSFLVKERRVRLPQLQGMGTPLTSFFLGNAFAAGWTPCIGPVLGTVLFFASTEETILGGMFLLAIFSLGLALPFLLVALMLDRATEAVTRITPYLHILSRLGGVVLILLGFHMLFGDTPLTTWFFDALRYLDFEHLLLRFL